MRHVATLLVVILSTSAAGAAEVYVTTDAGGQKIYTDIPQDVSARKLEIYNRGTSPATAAKNDSTGATRYEQNMKADPKVPARQVAPAAEDRAVKCAEVRRRYEMLMNSLRVYTLGPNGEQNFLTAEQMSEERVNAKQFLDRFCLDQ